MEVGQAETGQRSGGLAVVRSIFGGKTCDKEPGARFVFPLTGVLPSSVWLCFALLWRSALLFEKLGGTPLPLTGSVVVQHELRQR